MSDQVPPGLRSKKNLEVIDCTPHLKLQDMQILREAENRLVEAILNHYLQLIPKIERDFHDIYNQMRGVNQEERQLISLKLIHYKNGLMRKQRERDEKCTQWKEEHSKMDKLPRNRRANQEKKENRKQNSLGNRNPNETKTEKEEET